MRLAPRREAEEPTEDERLSEHEQEAELLRKRIEELAAATGIGRRPRVALEDQLLRLMPATAEGYRLVLGLDPLTNIPQLIPPPHLRGWRIMPFEAPDDPRLLPGQHYRIIWLDHHQREVPPLEIEPTPALYFFLGPPDAVVSPEQQECRRLQVANLQMQRQVCRLERELTEAKQAINRAEEKAREMKRKARKKIKSLKSKHRRDSLSKLLGTWGPPALAGAAGYLAGKGLAARRPARTEPTDAHPSPDTLQPAAGSTSETELQVLTAEERRHPLSVSFEMLSKVIHSEQEEPDTAMLSGMSEPELWSLIGHWLEHAEQTTPRADSARASAPRTIWSEVRAVGDAACAVERFGRVIVQLNDAPGKPPTFSISTNEMALFDFAKQLHGQFQDFVTELDSPAIRGVDRVDQLRTIAVKLKSRLREQRPQAGEALGQVIHDALNAIRLRLLRAVCLLEERQKQPPADPNPLSHTISPLLQLVARCTEVYMEDRFGIKLDIPFPPSTSRVENTGATKPKKRASSGQAKASATVTPAASEAPKAWAQGADKEPTTEPRTEAPRAVESPSLAIEQGLPMSEEQMLNFFRKVPPVTGSGVTNSEPDLAAADERISSPDSCIEVEPMSKERIAAFFSRDGLARSAGNG